MQQKARIEEEGVPWPSGAVPKSKSSIPRTKGRIHRRSTEVEGCHINPSCTHETWIERHTRNILLQNVELLEDRPDQALRMLVHDEDLPSPWRIH